MFERLLEDGPEPQAAHILVDYVLPATAALLRPQILGELERMASVVGRGSRDWLWGWACCKPIGLSIRSLYVADWVAQHAACACFACILSQPPCPASRAAATPVLPAVMQQCPCTCGAPCLCVRMLAIRQSPHPQMQLEEAVSGSDQPALRIVSAWPQIYWSDVHNLDQLVHQSERDACCTMCASMMPWE